MTNKIRIIYFLLLIIIFKLNSIVFALNTDERPQRSSITAREERYGFTSDLLASMRSAKERALISAAMRASDLPAKGPQAYIPLNTASEFYMKKKTTLPYASILSLDGGGMRGLMQAYWLRHLEYKDVTNRRPDQIFNIFAGTSIGGILSLAATIPGKEGNKPALSTQQMIEFFEVHGSKIFPQRYRYNPMRLWDAMWSPFSSVYDPRPLELLLQETFSSNPLSAARAHVVVTSASIETQDPILFTSYDPERSHYKAWEVGRATSAAPTYFPTKTLVLPGEHKEQGLVDGGLWMNNPSKIAYEEALYLWSDSATDCVLDDNIFMLSLGTGKIPVQHSQPYSGGWATSARSVIEAMMNYTSSGVHQSMKRTLKDGYFRVNPALPRDITLDSIDPSNISALREAAESEFERIAAFATDGRLRKILERDEIRENP